MWSSLWTKYNTRSDKKLENKTVFFTNTVSVTVSVQLQFMALLVPTSSTNSNSGLNPRSFYLILFYLIELNVLDGFRSLDQENNQSGQCDTSTPNQVPTVRHFPAIV